ncbi:ABC-type multidrug transport system ATPase component-like protein [Paracidovorax citrulli AAC00-1]|uniref:ABC-type multidrug transport system ATPase component-like protein n=2 Tax=Paracidovorax citrulli TaxID=80869 RepID=A1TNS8_PARC0|nr:ABC-type multidrug transport system ATPase component-like protein [Paracidovorax citrulli AAC00-1]
MTAPSPDPSRTAAPSAMPVLWSGLGLRHTPPGAATPLFVGLDLRIGPGTTLLRGGDGRGKTTLLRIIADALRPQAGRTGACGGGVFWADPRGEGPGLPAVQQTPVDWWAGQAQRWPDWSARALALHVEGFGLAGHAGKRMEQLSTGTRRKVLLAAGFACGAALVLVDEPVAGLDRPSVDHLRKVLAGFRPADGRGRKAWWSRITTRWAKFPGARWSNWATDRPRLGVDHAQGCGGDAALKYKIANKFANMIQM